LNDSIDLGIEGLLFGWFYEGEPHRLDGPSCVHFDQNTFEVLQVMWAIHGIYYDTKSEHDAVIELGEDIKRSRDLAIMHIKHPSKYITGVCQEILNAY
jgi:hypothetical protein